eukprot:scaffold15711_cov69-Cyclotella_meneghiniana.AAC.1
MCDAVTPEPRQQKIWGSIIRLMRGLMSAVWIFLNELVKRQATRILTVTIDSNPNRTLRVDGEND